MSKLELIIEIICEKGCAEVNEHIVKLQEGVCFSEIEGLTVDEKSQVLSELCEIMDAYKS